jgi:hypothetical protein
MAGSFGYEKNIDISMQMAKILLSKKYDTNAVAIAAAGTSCRHQIYDGTSRKQHPVSFKKLFEIIAIVIVLLFFMMPSSNTVLFFYVFRDNAFFYLIICFLIG